MSFKLSPVQKSLSGFVSVNNNLRYYLKSNIVVRNDLESLRPEMVRIITGGGSGHEPAHLGYIGKGKRKQTSHKLHSMRIDVPKLD